MIRMIFTVSAATTVIATAFLASTHGWLGDVFVGVLLNQAIIIAAGVIAETLVPGSGVIVINAMQRLLSVN